MSAIGYLADIGPGAKRVTMANTHGDAISRWLAGLSVPVKMQSRLIGLRTSWSIAQRLVFLTMRTQFALGVFERHRA